MTSPVTLTTSTSVYVNKVFVWRPDDTSRFTSFRLSGSKELRQTSPWRRVQLFVQNTWRWVKVDLCSFGWLSWMKVDFSVYQSLSQAALNLSISPSTWHKSRSGATCEADAQTSIPYSLLLWDFYLKTEAISPHRRHLTRILKKKKLFGYKINHPGHRTWVSITAPHHGAGPLVGGWAQETSWGSEICGLGSG